MQTLEAAEGLLTAHLQCTTTDDNTSRAACLFGNHALPNVYGMQSRGLRGGDEPSQPLPFLARPGRPPVRKPVSRCATTRLE
jgi:hypothetical protein